MSESRKKLKLFRECVAVDVTKAAIIGAVAALLLSSTTLSLLVIGALVGSLFHMLGKSSFQDELSKEAVLESGKRRGSYESAVLFINLVALAAGVGVGLAATADYLFPGFMLSAWSAVLPGAVIGGLAIAISEFASIYTDKYVVDPIVDKVAGLLSSIRKTE